MPAYAPAPDRGMRGIRCAPHTVRDYRVFEVLDAKDAEWSVVESIQVDSWEAWEAVGQRPEMQPLIERWKELADMGSASVVYGSEFTG